MKNALMVYLCIQSGIDLKHRKISFLATIFFLFIWVIMGYRENLLKICPIVTGIIPGIFLAAFSILSQQKVGIGDAIVVTVCGLYLGIFPTLAVLLFAFVLTAFLGSFLLLLKKATRNSCLPFIPFLALSYILLCLGGVL